MKTVTTRLRKFNAKLQSVTLQLQNLQQKKEDCVNAQNAMCDDLLDSVLACNRKYQKLIDLDFDLAEKILCIKRQILNIKAQIRRETKKALLCN